MAETLKVIIPMAGWGTRMRPHTWSKPKPLVGVAGRTALDYLLDMFKGDVTLSLAAYNAGENSVLRYGGSGSVSLKVGGDRYRNRYGLEALNYDGFTGELGWSPLPWLNVTGSVDIASRRVPEYEDQRRWGTVDVVVNASANQKLMASVGQTKGGLVCSGGFCRYEPAFRGMKCSWEWRF